MKLFKKYFKRLLLLSVAVLFLVGCDQATKQTAQKELSNKAKVEIAGIINFQYVVNDGGMLSFGKDLPQEIKFIFFILLVAVFLIILFFYIVKQEHIDKTKLFALVLIFSGGLGNLIDRSLNHGKVIDFIRIRIPLIESGIFNLADFYVTLGFLSLMIFLLKQNWNKKLSHIGNK